MVHRVDTILTKLSQSRKEDERVVLLNELQEIFLQNLESHESYNENIFDEFNAVVESWNEIFNEPVSNSSGNTMFFKGRMLVTLTTIVLCIDEILNINDYLSHVISICWAYASRPNQAKESHKYLRCIAIECLSEIEHTYPCILAAAVQDLWSGPTFIDPPNDKKLVIVPFSLFQCCQLEETYLKQSYVSLFVSIIHHLQEHSSSVHQPMLEETRPQDQSSFLERFHPTLYNPLNFRMKPDFEQYHDFISNDTKNLGCIAHTNILRSLSLVVKSISMSQPWVSVELMFKAYAFAHDTISDSLLMYHLSHFARSFDFMKVHVALAISATRPSLPMDFIEFVYSCALSVVNSIYHSGYARVLVLRWAAGYFATKPQVGLDVAQKLQAFKPREILDPIIVRYFKLVTHFAFIYEHPDNENMIQDCEIIKRVHLGLAMAEFACSKSTSKPHPNMLAVFEITKQIMWRFPRLTYIVSRYLTALILEHYHMLDEFATFLSQLAIDTQLHEGRAFLLEYLSRAFAKAEDASRLVAYRKVVSKIIENPKVHIVDTIGVAILRCLYVSESAWEHEQVMIDLCERILCVHGHKFLGPRRNNAVCESLAFLAMNSVETQNRCRAQELLDMTLTFPPHKWTEFLSPNSNKTSGFPNASSFSRGIGPQIVTEEQLSNFIILERPIDPSKIHPSRATNNVSICEDKDMIESYLMHVEKVMKLEIPIHVYLATKLSKDDVYFNECFGVVLEFTTKPHANTIEPVSIAYLRVRENHDLKRFPFVYGTILEIVPTHVGPFEFPVRVRLCLKNGSIMEGAVAALKIHFKDFLQTCPFPQNKSSEMFSRLWHDICLTKSAKYLQLDRDRILSEIHASFSDFIVDVDECILPGCNILKSWDPSNCSPETKHMNIYVAICLPPRFHLLMIFKTSPDSTLVAIAVDCLETLLHVDTFLESCFC